MACSCKLEALSQYLRSSLRSRVVTERSIHTKKRECPLEKAFAVPLIASMMLMACHPAEPQRVICDSCFSWGLFGKWPIPCDMVSTCTHGLQPCSWHKRHGKREYNNRKRSRCRRDGKRSSQAIVPPNDGYLPCWSSKPGGSFRR